MEIQSANSTSSDSVADNASSWGYEKIILSLSLFIIAGICEIGGGYLVWKGIRESSGKYFQYPHILYIVLGSLILIVYGVVPTFQPMDSFGRTFAVYGGFFIVLSYVWAMIFDGFVMDYIDYIGTSISLFGVLLIWFFPR